MFSEVFAVVALGSAEERPSSWAFEPGSVGDVLCRYSAEHGPAEWGQLSLWLLSAVLGCAMVVVLRRGRDRLFGAWLALVAGCVSAREVDAHEYLNPETLGAWGLRYRIDWWLSGETPVGLRVMWAVVAVVLLAAVFVPARAVSPLHRVLLRGGDVAWWCFLVSGVLMGLGWVTDDLVGRGQFVLPVYTRALEETLEVGSAVAFVAAMVLLLRVPLGEREARVRVMTGQSAGRAS